MTFKKEDHASVYNNLLLAVSAMLGVVVSLLTRPPREELLDRLFDA